MINKQLTCIICPVGCTIDVTLNDDGAVEKVSGNSCPRGEKYATAEFTAPERTVTTTVKASDGTVVSVKTDKPIPKDKVFECMQMINAVKIDLPVAIGDVIIENVFGANIVATKNA